MSTKKIITLSLIFVFVAAIAAFSIAAIHSIEIIPTTSIYEDDPVSVECFELRCSLLNYTIPEKYYTLYSDFYDGENTKVEVSVCNGIVAVDGAIPTTAKVGVELTANTTLYQYENAEVDNFSAQYIFADGTKRNTEIIGFGYDSAEAIRLSEADMDVIVVTDAGKYNSKIDSVAVKSFQCFVNQDYLLAGEPYDFDHDFAAEITYEDGTVRKLNASDVVITMQSGQEELQHGDNVFTVDYNGLTCSGTIKALAEPIIQSDEYPMFYRDLNTTIEITKERYADSDVFVAHVITSDPLALKKTFSEGGYNSHAVMSEVMEWRGAILMINGDFGDAANGGALPTVVDGEIIRLVNPPLRNRRTIGITTEGHFYEVRSGLYWEIENNHLRDCWTFNNGFTILNGERIVKYDGSKHPRTFIGEVLRDDGLLEYYLCVVDGRREDSRGFCHDDESAFLYEKGCSIAYNLDGGGSSEMMFDGKILNTPSDGHERRDHDFIYFARWQNDEVTTSAG